MSFGYEKDIILIIVKQIYNLKYKSILNYINIMFTTSENSNFLSDIAKQFISFRHLINEDESSEDSCLCRSCLKHCESIVVSECAKSYNEYLCYVEDGKCKTAASLKFCDRCKLGSTKIRSDFNKFKYQNQETDKRGKYFINRIKIRIIKITGIKRTNIIFAEEDKKKKIRRKN